MRENSSPADKIAEICAKKTAGSVPAVSPYFCKRDLKYASYSSSVSLGTFCFFAITHLARSFSTSMPLSAQDYSVRSAMTGSFFAAADAGMSPEMSVSATETHTMMNAVSGCRAAMPEMPVRLDITMLITRESR